MAIFHQPLRDVSDSGRRHGRESDGCLQYGREPGGREFVLRQQFALTQVNTQLTFMSNALPAFVELELGVLEPVALKQYQALTDSPAAAATFLKKQPSKVHLFRQRVPIRTVLQ